MRLKERLEKAVGLWLYIYLVSRQAKARYIAILTFH